MMRSTELKRIRTSHFRGRGVTAALPPFKRTGKGSNPFGPISRRQASGRRKINDDYDEERAIALRPQAQV